MNRKHSTGARLFVNTWRVYIAVTLLCTLAGVAFAQSPVDRLFATFLEESYNTGRRELADSVSRSLSDGKVQEAVRQLQQASELGSAPPSAPSLARALGQAKSEQVLGGNYLVMNSAHRWQVVPLPASEQIQVRALNEIRVSWFRTTFVTPASKEFIEMISPGAQNSKPVIDACLRGEGCDFNEQMLVRTCVYKLLGPCVFAIGSGLDAPFLDKYRESMRASGKHVFFYKDCAVGSGHLCNPRLIGAVMAQADDVMFIDSANAAKSEYAFPELAAVQRLRKGQTAMIMVSREDLMAAVQSAASTAVKVTEYTISSQYSD